jgi:DNA-binding NarL/FixJ family response regulator
MHIPGRVFNVQKMSFIRIILADADEISLAGLEKLLELEFEIVAKAYDGHSLLDASAKLHPDVVLTELQLPDLSAMEVIRRLKSEGSSTGCVILARRGDGLDVREAFEAGASAFVLKREHPDYLCQVIRMVAQGFRQIVSPALLNSNEDPPMERLGQLTPRQLQVMRLLAEGKSRKEVAAMIDISIRTVEFHKNEIMRRLGIRNKAELTATAIRHGLLPR